MRRGKLMDKLLKKIVSGMVLTLLLISIVTLPCNIQPVKAESRNVIATYGSGYLEDVDGLLVLHVKGSPYEMGYQHGFLLRDRVEAAIQYFINSLDDYEYFVNCAQAMEQYIPQEYIQEMQGLADGANLEYIDVLICQPLPDLVMIGGCSGFAVCGNATTDGHLYHGRNNDWDFPPEIIPLMTSLVIVYEPENGNAYVSVASFGAIGLASGMNNQGISVGMKGSPSTDVTLDGMPFFLMLKKVLQYSDNLTEAIDIISQTPRTSGWNILLGDGKTPDAVAVEISANYCEVFWAGDPAEDIEPHYSIPNAVRRANHYVDPDLAATQRSPYDPRGAWDWSWNRYEKLSQLIEDNYGNIDAEMSMDFMRTPPVAWDPINLNCILFDPTDLELWVACANSTTPAYLREFIYLSYDDLFSEYLVDLTLSSTAGGNVTTPGEGTSIYEKRTVVDLVATPDAGYHFDSWTGNVSTVADVEDATTTITMEDDYDITANFEANAPGVCFIATAAYGTPMAEEIEILREFRDGYLLTNPVGQGLVEFYYKVSPPIAEFINEHPSLKPIVRAGLLPAVAMSVVAVNTGPAEKMTVIGLLVLISVAVAIWTTKRRGRGLEYT